LGSVSRVTVESRSALLDTAAGKLDMAEKLLQIPGALGTGDKAAKALVQVFRTGNLDPLLADEEKEDLLIARENDMLSEGRLPVVMPSDPHALHIQHHRAVVASPEARENPAILQAHLEHEQAHIDALRLTDPGLLLVLGQQPIPPEMMPLGAPPMPPGADSGAPMPADMPPLAPEAQQQAPGGPGMPNLPQMPINPATGERAPAPPMPQ
jgi:hypothetical protein